MSNVTVNGVPRSFSGDLAKPLLWALREDWGLTGTKFGCGHDICGACTVHVDGVPRHACAMTVGDAVGARITTIEGLAGETFHPVQAAWISQDVGQCGYCQPGMVMAAAALLEQHPKPSDAQAAAALPNLCRCATYARVKQALASASDAPSIPLPTPGPEERFIDIGDWVRLGEHGRVIINISQSELGQGSSTGLAMLVAEELDCDWARVRAQIATGRDAYRITLLGYRGQFVGGSLSSTLLHDRLRKAGAAVRAVLVSAAAAEFGVVAETCVTQAGQVLHPQTGRSASYAALAPAAARLALPEAPPLKDAAQFALIGAPQLRLDATDHVLGRSTFGMDVSAPDMLVGAIRFAGGFGAKLISVDDRAARAIPGVEQIVKLEDAVVVLARGYWEAQRGADALVIEADETAGRGLSTEAIFAANHAALDQQEAVIAVDAGGASALLAAAGPGSRHAAVYEVPYLAHATIEPVVATVHIEADRATIWAPTQGQDVIRDRIAKIFGMEEAAVTVHTTFVGGGFGRKFVPDFVIQAAFASKACGRPVKLMRSRAEDMRHDFYRPGLVARFEASLDDEGYPKALRARIAGQSLLYQMFPMWVVNGVDEATVEGANDQPYAIPNLRVEMVDVQQIVPMGFMRSVGRSANVFFVESFLDELAEKAGVDPYAYRRRLLAGDSRALAVLDAAAERSGWNRPLEPDRFRGIAYAPYIGRGQNFTTRVATVLETRRHASGACSVERVVVAIDPGLVINPNLVRAQVEGCVGFALSSVMKGEITLRDGVVDQHDFASFPLLTLSEMPEVETIIIQGDTEAPAGVGEAAMPVIGPALASALRAATGQRPRSMPFDRHVAFAPRWSA